MGRFNCTFGHCLAYGSRQLAWFIVQKMIMETKCLFCGSNIQLVFVHGHYQCPVCKTNALPCCDGDNCNNAFLSAPVTDTDKNKTDYFLQNGN